MRPASLRLPSPSAGSRASRAGKTLAALSLFALSVMVPAPASGETAGQAHAHRFRADPVLVDVAVAAGVEPHDRGQGSVATGSPVAFHFGGQALWRGLVGPALGLYASVGSPVLTGTDARGERYPSLADRVSVVAAVALRPLAFLCWHPEDTYLRRLAGGFGVELGASAEVTRTSLDLVAAPGFHGLVMLDVPLWGDGGMPGLSLRLASRVLITKEQRFAPDQKGVFQVVEPGLAVQLFAGLSYSL